MVGVDEAGCCAGAAGVPEIGGCAAPELVEPELVEPELDPDPEAGGVPDAGGLDASGFAETVGV